MTELLATRSSRGHRTICLPFAEEAYSQIIGDPAEFRRAIDDRFRTTPELFPARFADGYRLKDDRVSAKLRDPDPTRHSQGWHRLQHPALVPHALHDRPHR